MTKTKPVQKVKKPVLKVKKDQKAKTEAQGRKARIRKKRTRDAERFLDIREQKQAEPALLKERETQIKNKDNRPQDATLSSNSGQALRNRAEDDQEEIAREKAPQLPADLEALSIEETRRLLHELRVHQIELEMRNKELHRAKERYKHITGGLTDYRYTVRVEEGRAVETRQGSACVIVTGYTAEEFAAYPYLWFQMIAPKDCKKVQERVQQILAGNEIAPIEHRIVRKDGEIRWVRDTVILNKDAAGKLLSYDGMIKDITESKWDEERLKNQNVLLSSIINSAQDIIIFALDRNYRYVAFNEKHRREMKMVYNADIEIGRSMLDYISVLEIKPVAKASFDRVLKGESFNEIQQQPNLGIWYEFFWNPIRTPEGQIIGISAFIRDIAERKQEEEALRESEEKYRMLFDLESDAIFIIENETGRLLTSNSAAVHLYGYSKEELCSMKNTDLSAEQEQTRQVTIETAVDLEKVVRVPLRWHRKKDGTRFPVEITGRFFNLDGRNVHIAAIRDISDRKQAEKKLWVKDWAIESAINAIAIADLKENLDYVNQSFLKLWGYNSPAEVLGKPAVRFWQMGEKAGEVMEAVHTKGGWIGELVAQGKDGVLFDVYVASSMVVDDAGRPICMQASFVDITRRKRAEEALNKEKRFAESLIETAQVIVLVLDPQGCIVSFNPYMQELFGFRLEEVRGRDWFSTFLPVDKQNESRELFQGAIGDIQTCGNVNTLKTKDGRSRDIEWYDKTLKDDQGRITGLLVIGQNVTERKRAEEALRESEKLLLEMTTQVPGVVYQFYARPNGEMGFYYVSDRSERILGLKPDLAGYFERFTAMVLPEYRESFIASIAKSVKESSEWKYEGMLKKPSGEKIWFFGNSTPSSRENEMVFNGIVFDITERKLTEQALRESENKLHEAQKLAHIGVWDWKADTDTVTWTEELYRIAGRDPMLPAPTYAEHPTLYAPESWEVLKTAVERAMKTGEPYQLELTLIRPDNSTRYVNAFSGAKYDTQGQINGLYGSVQDITERVQAEEALRESEKKYRLLIDTANESIIVAQDGLLKFVNPMTLGLLEGYSEQELIDRPFPEFIHPDDRSMVVENYKRRIANEGARSRYAFRVVTRDGNVKWVEINATLLEWQGKPATLNFLTDITERVQAETALRESEKKYRQLLESLNEGIWYIDRDSRTSYANPRMAVMLGYTVEEMLGKHLFDFMDEEGRKIAQTNLERRQQGIKEQHDFEFLRKDGKRVYASLETAPITDESGNYVGAIAGVQDITERRRLEEERMQMEAQLQKAQRLEAIGTLAGGIAHDFNNILYAILGNAEMVQSDLPEKSPIRFSVDQIMKAGYRARDLVQQILTFSRQTEEEVMAVDATVLTKETLKLLRASLPATIKICRQITVKHKTVLADPIQIHQILMNLCTNAHHAMLEKGGILDVSLSDEEISENRAGRYQDLKPGSYIKLTISDTGCGMSAEIMSRIFDPYFTTRDKRGGTGLGLAVVYGIVKKLGGFIGVQSELGKGSTFEVLLPSIDSQCLPDPVSFEPIPGGTESILFVDNEEAITDLAQRSLQRWGYRVVAKTGSTEALELFKTEPARFDLVITDMAMPNLTGEDLAIEFMRMRPDLPVILCTGFSERINEEKALALGVKAFILKPLVMRELAIIIRKVLDGKK